MTTRESKILLRYQLKDEVSRGLDTIGGNIKQHSRQVGLALTAVGAVGILAGKSVVQAALEQQKAERTLAAVVEATGASWEDHREKVLRVTKALQAKTNFADEQQFRVLTRLLPTLKDVNLALDALPLVLAASAASTLEVSGIARTLGQALAGVADTSESLGLVFEANENFSQRLARGWRAVGNAAEANFDPIVQMTIQLRTMKEIIGAALLPVVIPLFKAIGTVALAIGNFAENNKALIQILAPLVVTLVLLAAVAGPLLLILPGIALAVGFVSIAMFGWVIAIAAIVAAVVILTVIVIRNWDAIRDAVIGTINLIITAINALVEALFQLSGFGVLNRISGALGGPSVSGVPNIPTISTMDTGGLVRGPGMFQVGAGVTEIVRTPGGGGGSTVVVNIPASSLMVVQDRDSIQRFASLIERQINTQSNRGRRRFST